MNAGFTRSFAVLSLAAATALLTGCPPADEGMPSLTINADPRSVPADGESLVSLTVSGTDADGNPLSGQLLLNTNKGSFQNGGGKALNGVLTNGVFQATLVACDSQADPTCSGPVRISALYQGSTATTSVTFQALEASCRDGVDDDGDGQTDCADPDCQPFEADALGAGCDAAGQKTCAPKDAEGNPAADTVPSEPQAEATCYDGFDNDCDGLIDCDDPDCSGEDCVGTGSGACGVDQETGENVCGCDFDDPSEGIAVGDCFDGVDSDCDGLVDGDDPDCLGKPCNDLGDRYAADGSCACFADETGTELSCSDGFDNDCGGASGTPDGADCADTDCEGRPCELGDGRVDLQCGVDGAGNNTCICPGDPAGVGIETTCDDGLDNDCDGLVDCADVDTDDCPGRPCGPNGEICTGGACACPNAGPEQACSDNSDNDCDGLVDCADPDCGAMACDTTNSALTCLSDKTCGCAGGAIDETTPAMCADGQDNDCDGLVDCEENACYGLQCASGKVCLNNACVADPGENGLALSIDKSAVPADGLTVATLTATVTNGGAPVPNHPVTFEITSGGLVEASGAQSHTVNTDAGGVARVGWRPEQIPAAQLVATARTEKEPVNHTEAVKTVNLKVVGLFNIEFVSAEWSTMGLKDSGWRETSELTYRLKGTDGVSDNLPMPDGAVVTFTPSTTAGNLALSRTTATSLNSKVTTTALAGTQVVQFTVRALAEVGLDTDWVDSTGLSIIGAKPSHKGFTLSCSKRNVNGLGVFLADSTPETTTVSNAMACTATINDRALNPIARPDLLVKFFAEGGTIQSDKPIQDGVATTNFDVRGDLPEDVAPLAGEPRWNHTFSYTDGSGQQVQVTRTRNPRDGFVSIIAYITGEEEYVDSNGNGAYDQGEEFVDLAEPFIDANDNGQLDTGETPFDANNDGQWNGPNGVWDSNTLIWTETRVMVTGCQFRDDTGSTTGYPTGFLGAYTEPLGEGASETVPLRVADINLNRPRGGTTFSVTKRAGYENKINVELTGGSTTHTLVDAWGLGWGLQRSCTSGICVLRPVVEVPDNGATIGVTVSDGEVGDDIVDPTPWGIRVDAGPCTPFSQWSASGTNN